MSSKILSGVEQPAAAPVLWRVVESPVDLPRGGKWNKNADRESQALDQARREAFAAGVAAGRREAEEQIRPAMEGLAGSLAELARLREAIREESNHDLVRLAVSIAGRVIHREAAVDPDALGGLIKAAYVKLQSREINRVRMQPVLESLVRKSLEQCGSPNNLVLIADPSLTSGQVLFETSQGILDASVDTQLREIERGLIDRLER